MSSLELWDFLSASSFIDIDLTGTSGLVLVRPGPGEPLSEEVSSARTEFSTGEAGASLGDIRMLSDPADTGELGEMGEMGLEMELRDSRLSCLCGAPGFPKGGGGGIFF